MQGSMGGAAAATWQVKGHLGQQQRQHHQSNTPQLAPRHSSLAKELAIRQGAHSRLQSYQADVAEVQRLSRMIYGDGGGAKNLMEESQEGGFLRGQGSY